MQDAALSSPGVVVPPDFVFTLIVATGDGIPMAGVLIKVGCGLGTTIEASLVNDEGKSVLACDMEVWVELASGVAPPVAPTVTVVCTVLCKTVTVV